MKKNQIICGCAIFFFGLLFILGMTTGSIPELSYLFLLPLGVVILESLLKWQSDNHVSGTMYSDEYLDEIRKIINSPTGKYGWRPEV